MSRSQPAERKEGNNVVPCTSTKRNLTKGAFTLKFYAFKVYTNSPEFHLVLVQRIAYSRAPIAIAPTTRRPSLLRTANHHRRDHRRELLTDTSALPSVSRCPAGVELPSYRSRFTSHRVPQLLELRVQECSLLVVTHPLAARGEDAELIAKVGSLARLKGRLPRRYDR